MNETISTILKRRSVRAYRPNPVGQLELELMLEAARYAPTAMNQQPWHFTVIRNPDLLGELEEHCLSAFIGSKVNALREIAKQEGFSVFYHAPVLVIISGDPEALAPQSDCTLAMENMMIAATSLGIGSCWANVVMMYYSTDKGQSSLRRARRHLPRRLPALCRSRIRLPSGSLPRNSTKKIQLRHHPGLNGAMNGER